jgi:hypothetical protein
MTLSPLDESMTDALRIVAERMMIASNPDKAPDSNNFESILPSTTSCPASVSLLTAWGAIPSVTAILPMNDAALKHG